MSTKELTCVVCPAGCRITVTLDEAGRVTDVTGQTCVRGKKYAESEVTHPVRTLTSTVTVQTKDGVKMLPVRTDRPIPRPTLFEAMEIVRTVKASAPIHTGDILVENFIEEGTNLIACKDFE
ncbi:MAG: DUF1667 domain-containing protein [Eubacteriales bacterium]